MKKIKTNSVAGNPLTYSANGKIVESCEKNFSGHITIPEGVTEIASFAFSGCHSLTSVTIPASVIDIGYFALSDCAGLTNIAVDAGNANYSSQDGVLFNKDKTELLVYPAGKPDAAYTVPSSVTNIRAEAFFRCDYLTSVTVPPCVLCVNCLAYDGPGEWSV